MAQIDPSIALGFKQPQFQDPIAATARAQEIGVNALKMNEMQRGLESQNKLRELFSQGIDVSTPEGFKQLAAVDPATAMKLRTDALQSRKLEGDIKKTGLEITAKDMDIAREGYKNLQFKPSDNNFKSFLEDSVLSGKMTPTQAQQQFAEIAPLNIDQRREFIKNRALKAEQLFTDITQRRGQDITASTARRGQDKPVFSADYGGFVVPPSANAPQGSFVPVTGPTGAPLESSKPLTEGQAKGVGFALRAREADQILNTIGKKGEVQPGLIKRTLESTPFIGEGLGTMANVTQSAAQQQVEQAQRNFVNAVLRQESGAVINEDEFNNAKKQYFPQPGDSDKVIKQKEQARKTTIKALETQAGPGLRRAGGGKAEDPLGIR
jgi:hypothetical protein